MQERHAHTHTHTHTHRGLNTLIWKVPGREEATHSGQCLMPSATAGQTLKEHASLVWSGCATGPGRPT